MFLWLTSISRIVQRAQPLLQFVAAQPAPPPAVTLPLELLHIIFKSLVPITPYASDNYWLDLFACCLVCRDWHHAARPLLGDFVSDCLKIESWWDPEVLPQLSSLVAISSKLPSPYTISITTLSIHLHFFIPNAMYPKISRPTANQVLYLLSLASTLHTFILTGPGWNYTPRDLYKITRFLDSLRPLCTRITSLVIHAPYRDLLREQDPAYEGLIAAFAPNVLTIDVHPNWPNVLTIDAQPNCHFVPARHPTLDQPRHLAYNANVNSGLVMPFPYIFPDPVHCSISGDEYPRFLSFVFDDCKPPPRMRRGQEKPDDVIEIYGRKIRCRSLRSLHVTGRFFDASRMLELARRAPNLRSLKLEDKFPAMMSTIDYVKERWVGVRWPVLRELDIEGCNEVDPVMLEVFVAACPDLAEIRVGIEMEMARAKCEEVLREWRFLRDQGAGAEMGAGMAAAAAGKWVRDR